MGSGASAGVKESLQGASVDELKAALAGLSEGDREKIVQAMDASSELAWKNEYIALVSADLKDHATALPLVWEYKAEECKTGLVPRCVVLGKPTKLFPDETEKRMKDKAVWFQMYNDVAAAMDEKLTTKHTDFVLNTFKDHYATDNLEKDLQCIYIGTCYHLEKPGGTSGDHFYFMGSFKCKDAASAQKAQDMLKAHGLETLKEEGALRMTVVPPSAVDSLAPEEKDDVEVRYFKAFKASADWDKHQETASYKDTMAKLAECLNDPEKDITGVLWFADAKTFAA